MGSIKGKETECQNYMLMDEKFMCECLLVRRMYAKIYNIKIGFKSNLRWTKESLYVEILWIFMSLKWAQWTEEKSILKVILLIFCTHLCKVMWKIKLLYCKIVHLT